MSLAALEALIAGVKVRCEVIERDRHGRQGLLAQRVDVGRRLVSAGWVYRRYSMDYVDAQDEARRGMWRSTFLTPLGMARIVARRHPPLDSSRDATATDWIVQTFARRGRSETSGLRYPAVRQMPRTPSRPG
jgi:hypothetical protein